MHKVLNAEFIQVMIIWGQSCLLFDISEFSTPRNIIRRSFS